MKNNKKEAMGEFLGDEQPREKSQKGDKNVVINEREGLIERVDRVYVTKDGKQLLREQY